MQNPRDLKTSLRKSESGAGMVSFKQAMRVVPLATVVSLKRSIPIAVVALTGLPLLGMDIA